MKKSLIAMSINKQLYFGIFGISSLFGVFCLLLIILASTKLFFSYNTNMKALFNTIDTNIVALNGENADLFGQLFFTQGKFETYILRYYFNLFDDFGKELMDIINIEQSEINKYFISDYYYNDNTNICNEENSKCFFIYSRGNVDDNLKKKLYILRPILDKSLEVSSYTRGYFNIFNKFNFYDKETNTYITYKYNKNFMKDAFNNSFPPITLMNNSINYLIGKKDSIEELNFIKINEVTYEEFFNQNSYILFPSNTVVVPFFNSPKKDIHFSSFLFNLNANDKVDINQVKLDNLNNYLSLDIELDYLSVFSFNFIFRNGAVFVAVTGLDLNFTTSKSLCKFINNINYTYSDYSIKNPMNFTYESLSLEEDQIYYINECFPNPTIQQTIQSDTNYNYKLKVLSSVYKYNYDKDINNNIKIKFLRVLSPTKYIRNLIRIRFYSSFSLYYLVFKIYNNITVMELIIDRITFRSVLYITLFTFLLWALIFGFTLVKLYLVTDRISSPIRKLIKSLSLNQDDFDKNELYLEKIYYKEDKDINDLFQLCQKLIIGGFKKKGVIKKKTGLNVYNNVSKVKTNNMIINETDIINQRNQKYNEIFEKGVTLETHENKFANDIYYKFKDKALDTKIHNYENSKIKKMNSENKEEIESIKNKDNEYKMFYYINREIENMLPYNNLYKCYYEEFSKKANKKKKK